MPPPIQTTPSSVTPNDAVADGRTSESPKTTNEKKSADMIPAISQDLPPSSSPTSAST